LHLQQIVILFRKLFLSIRIVLNTGAIMPGHISIKLLFFMPVLLLLNGCQASLPAIPEPPAGTYRVSTDTTYNMSNRTFLVHVPPEYHPKTPLPLVVVVHGAFSTGSQTEIETGFSTLADSEHFLVAYPEGIGIFGLFQHWNAGHCCGKAADDQVDDVGFIAEVIRTVRRKLAVDPNRIYLAGMSNGGMLTYRFAAERTGDLAAAAVVSGAIGSSVENEARSWQIQQPGKALPIIGFHGLADEAVPAGGGISPRKQGNRSYLPVADALDYWRTADGCGTSPAVTTSNNPSVNHLTWENCRDGSSIEFFLLAGWGHQWPAPYFTDRLEPDNPLKGFDATRLIWTFFSKFRRFEP
jgi:polyhydroxybutyrate depolymerase